MQPDTHAVPRLSSFASPVSTPVSKSSPRRKSPSLPPLNLDNFNFYATTSHHANLSPTTTAFVFTSSRTLRAQQELQRSSEPPSPASTASTTQPHVTHHRPTLSHSQLYKHSHGATDTRLILGPNMRAAGFVPIGHTLSPVTHSVHSPGVHGHPDSATDPQTPGSSGSLPTPNDPPPFPPLMFVSPSIVATSPMWDYQKSRGVGNKETAGPNLHENASTSNESLPTSFSTMFSSASLSTVPSSVSSGLLQPSASIRGEKYKDKGKAKVSALTTDSAVDGYPFPRTPPQSQHPRASDVTSSPAPSVSSFALSTSMSSSSAGTSQSDAHHASRHAAHRLHLHTKDKSKPKDAPKTKKKQPKSIDSKKPITAVPTSKHTQQLSFTELCDFTSPTWGTDSHTFMPVSPSVHSRSRTSGSIFSATSAAALERSKAAAADAVASSRRKEKERAKAAEALAETERNAVEEKAKDKERIRLRDADAEAHRERRKERERAKEKGQEIMRETDRLSKEDSTLGSSTTPTKTHVRHKERLSHSFSVDGDHPGARGRDPRGKMLGISEENDLNQGQRDHIALVHAHRERDREQARERVREKEQREKMTTGLKLGKRSGHVHAKTKGKSLLNDTPSDTETMVDIVGHPNTRNMAIVQ